MDFINSAVILAFPNLSGMEIALIITALVLLAVIAYMLRNNNPQETNMLFKKTNQYKIRLKKAKVAYDKLKNDFDKLKQLYEFDEQKIKELNEYIADLEEINKELHEKKLLAESKYMKLEDLKKRRDELFAINIHDLKNPLNVIRGYTTLIKEYDLTVDEQKDIMDSMTRSADKMLKIIGELTEVIKKDIDSEVEKKEFSIRHIIDDVCRNNAAYVKRKGINLLNKTQVDIPVIMGNSNKIETAIDNLINNAIKYGPEGTNIEIRTQYDQDYVKVEVVDDGVGMTEEEQKVVFNKGKTLSNKPTAGEDQSGLGLWIVKQVIEEHGGKVWVKSAKGEGATFGFKLPRKISD